MYKPQIPDKIPLLGDTDSRQVGLGDVDQWQALLNGTSSGFPLVPLHVIGIVNVELVIILLAAVGLVWLGEPAYK